MAEQIFHGSCLCGAVTYQVKPPLLRFVYCHCSRCRKATGSAHASNLRVAPANFAWISGQDNAVRFDLPSALSFATAFCKRCGSPLPRLTRDGQTMMVPAGSLDEDPGLRPQARIFWGSRAPWSCSGDELPRFPERPD